MPQVRETLGHFKDMKYLKDMTVYVRLEGVMAHMRLEGVDNGGYGQVDIFLELPKKQFKKCKYLPFINLSLGGIPFPLWVTLPSLKSISTTSPPFSRCL